MKRRAHLVLLVLALVISVRLGAAANRGAHLDNEMPFGIEKHFGGDPVEGLFLRRVWAGPYRDRHRFTLVFGLPGSARRAQGRPPFHEVTVLQSVPTHAFIEIWGVQVDDLLLRDSFQQFDSEPFSHFVLQNYSDRVSITLSLTAACKVQVLEKKNPSRIVLEIYPARLRSGLKDYYVLTVPAPEMTPASFRTPLADIAVGGRNMMDDGFHAGWYSLFDKAGENYLKYGAGLSRRKKDKAVFILREAGFKSTRVRLFLPPEDGG